MNIKSIRYQSLRKRVAKLVSCENKLIRFEIFPFYLNTIDNVRTELKNFVEGHSCVYIILSNSFRFAYLKSGKYKPSKLDANYESINNSIIYIGESGYGYNRLKKFFNRIKGGRASHSGGENIHKFIEEYSSYFPKNNYFFSLIIFITTPGCHKDLEGCLLLSFKNMFGYYPLFNNREEYCCCLKQTANKILMEIVEEVSK